MCRPGRLTTRKRPNLSTIAELCCLTIKSPENKVRDFIMRQLNIQEALDSILNLKIPEKIIEKGDKSNE